MTYVAHIRDWHCISVAWNWSAGFPLVHPEPKNQVIWIEKNAFPLSLQEEVFNK